MLLLRTITAVIICCLLLRHLSSAQAKVSPPLKFRKVLIAAESFESAGVFDVNKDGHPDIISGNCWYQGPAFQQRHYIGAVKRHGEYYDDFSTIPLDVNGDGYTDFITGGWWGNTVRWRQNPGQAEGEWQEHVIGECGNVECAGAWDVDGDGTPEIVPNNPGRPLRCYRLQNGAFREYRLADKQDHGLGFGDINGDGRGDFILSNGWLEAPPQPWQGKWTLHQEFQLGSASVPVIVADVNGDGLNDLIAGQGHDYGLDWYEQQQDKRTQQRKWIKHPIDPFNSQFHVLLWEDIDNDGRPELITGKRYRAHNEKDPGSFDDIGLYYYKWNGESFTKQVISYGPPGVGKGTGIYFAVADLRNTGRKDIVVAGKEGLYVFFNEE